MSENRIICPDCDVATNRRQFMGQAGGIALAAGGLHSLSLPSHCMAAPTAVPAETWVTELYKTLSDSQRKIVCLPFEHEKRFRISANWQITEPEIGSDFYSTEQRGLIDKILRSVTSEDGYQRFLRQMDDDAGGIESYSIALFGQPGTGKFEWEMTGRHLTIRADGDSVENAAFGGPIVYGHGEGDSESGLRGNVFAYQVKMANVVFLALDEQQRAKALLQQAPAESDVALRGEQDGFPGIRIGELSSDQKDLVEMTIKIILAPYRESDVEEALRLLKQGGGLDNLRLSFYKTDADGEPDLGEDGEWEIWRLEGPTFVWHFRGQPHVHTYVNIGQAV